MNEMVKRLTAERDALRAEVAALRRDQYHSDAVMKAEARAETAERELAEARALLARIASSHCANPKCPCCNEDVEWARAFLRRDEARRCQCAEHRLGEYGHLQGCDGDEAPAALRRRVEDTQAACDSACDQFEEAQRDLAEARAHLAWALNAVDLYAKDAGETDDDLSDEYTSARVFLRRDEARRCTCGWDARPDLRPFQTEHSPTCPARDEDRGAVEWCTCTPDRSTLGIEKHDRACLAKRYARDEVPNSSSASSKPRRR